MRKIFVLFTLGLFCAGAMAAKPEQARRVIPGSRATVLLFVASQCPCTDQHRLIVSNLLDVVRPQGVKFYCVFSNYGETGELIQHFYRNIGWQMPYLMDGTSKLADRYGASTTPTAIVLDHRGRVVFTGPIDDGAKNQGRVDRAWLREALDDVLADRPVRTPEAKHIGCWIVRKSDLESHQAGS